MEAEGSLHRRNRMHKMGRHWTYMGNKFGLRRREDWGDVRLMCGSHGRCFCRQPERHILGNQSGSG